MNKASFICGLRHSYAVYTLYINHYKYNRIIDNTLFLIIFTASRDLLATAGAAYLTP